MKHLVSQALLAVMLLAPAASAFHRPACPRGGQPCDNRGTCDKSQCPKKGECDGKGPNGTGPRR